MPCCEDPDGVGKPCVQRTHQRFGIRPTSEREAGGLSQRMHAGVGAPRTNDDNFPLIEIPKRVLEQTLDGRARCLSLPPDKVGAVIRQGDLKGLHSGETKDGSPRRHKEHEVFHMS